MICIYLCYYLSQLFLFIVVLIVSGRIQSIYLCTGDSQICKFISLISASQFLVKSIQLAKYRVAIIVKQLQETTDLSLR